MIGSVSTSLPAPDPVEGAAAPGTDADAAAAAALFGDLVAQLLAPPAAPAPDGGAPGSTPSAPPVELAPAAAIATDRPAALAPTAPAIEPVATAEPDAGVPIPTPTATALPGPTTPVAPGTTATATPAVAAAAAAPTPERPRAERSGWPAPAPAIAAEPHPATLADDAGIDDTAAVALVDRAGAEPEPGAEPLPTTAAPGPDATATATDPAPVDAAATPAPPPAPDAAPPLHEQVAVKVRSLHLHEGDRHSITVDLHPAELGAVTLEVRVQDGRVDVTLRAERPGAAEALGGSLHDLADALGGHGFDVGDLDVAPRLPLERWTPPPAPGHGELPDHRRTPQHERHPDHRPPEPDDHLVFDALL